MVETINAFIPARGGSCRVPHKNTRDFFRRHPLIAYAIQGALDAGIFDNVLVSSDSADAEKIALYYGAKFIRRPVEFATAVSPDQEWIDHALSVAPCERYAILRPTNPFRTARTIRDAYEAWDKESHMKSVREVTERPEKMWKMIGDEERPIMYPFMCGEHHLCQSSTFPPLYVQNGCIEFRVSAYGHGMPLNSTSAPLARMRYQPYFTAYPEDFDINTMRDWNMARLMVRTGIEEPNFIEREPYYGR